MIESKRLPAIGGTVPSAMLYKASAQEILADPAALPDESIDLVLTDPPYVISKPSGFRNLGADGQFQGDPRFAIHTDFGQWDHTDGFSLSDLGEVIGSLYRVLRPGGTVIVFFDLWKATALADMLAAAEFEKVRMAEWLKTNAVPINSRATYLNNARETAVVAHKPGPQTYCPTSTTGIYRHPIHHGRDRFHPTQKSLTLFEELVGIHCRAGDRVLDCFSGSATTGVAALRRGCSYVGCEPDPTYFDRSFSRLEETHNKLREAGRAQHDTGTPA